MTSEDGSRRVVRIVRAVWTAGGGEGQVATVVDVETNEHFEVPLARLRKLDDSRAEQPKD